VEIPAFFFLGIWFILQFLNAAGSPAHGAGVAWWAHIGGFACGMLMIRAFVLHRSASSAKPADSGVRRRHTHRLQTIRTAGDTAGADLHGRITLTPMEAEKGALKLVNLPWGFHSRLFKLRVPPKVRDGSTLRLKGMGRGNPDGSKGNLYLRVNVE
jgi:hypothetical protein